MRAAGFVSSLVVLAAVALAAAAGCDADPVHTAAVNALGPEAPGIPVGPLHRAGQPCGVCHSGEGPASTTFVVSGTIFYGPGLTAPPVGVGNATVSFLDDSQSQHTVQTNCVGNFYVAPGDWSPKFPLLVSVAAAANGSTQQVAMQSLIGRTDSCGTCHLYPTRGDYFETPGLIHLVSQDDTTFKGQASCPVQPPVPVGLVGLP